MYLEFEIKNILSTRFNDIKYEKIYNFCDQLLWVLEKPCPFQFAPNLQTLVY